jgi:hypothetical protein
MARDRVNPIKWERPSEGGTENDEVPSELDHHEDYINTRGIAFQDAESNDEAVIAERDTEGNMLLLDGVVHGSRKLAHMEYVKNVVPEGVVFLVHEDFEHLIYGKFTIDGQYKIDGISVVI